MKAIRFQLLALKGSALDPCRDLNYCFQQQHQPDANRAGYADVSVAEVETLLNHCNRNYRAFDSRGLALSGMALLEKIFDVIG